MAHDTFHGFVGYLTCPEAELSSTSSCYHAYVGIRCHCEGRSHGGWFGMVPFCCLFSTQRIRWCEVALYLGGLEH